MKIININGPINAGKTTISKLLVSELKVALFIEVMICFLMKNKKF